MTQIFLKMINMSLTAVFLILAVILLRLIFKKAPKWISCLLWAIVAIRLLVPFTLESPISVLPTAEPVKTYAQTSEPYLESGLKVLDTAANKIISKPVQQKKKATVKTAAKTTVPENIAVKTWKPVDLIAIFWLSGTALLLIYSSISYLRLKKLVFAAVKTSGRVWICDEIDTPFILGIIRPRIYLPSSLTEDERKYVLEHEYAHLARFDHIWKPLSFLILAVHWFNPMCWIAYVLFGRDVELACDEKAVKDMSKSDKLGYTTTLVNLSCPKLISACPLAYAEIGVKKRVKSILNYKKPAFWLIAAALISSVALSGCFLTNKPAKTSEKETSTTTPAPITAESVVSKADEPFPYAELRAAKKNPVPEDILKILSDDNRIECYGNYPGAGNINKIVSLDPSITSELFWLGVEDKIVGIDSESSPDRLNSDVTVFDDAKAVIRSLPDIIFITDRTWYLIDDLTLTSSGLCVIKIPEYTHIHHAAEDLRFLGALIGKTDRAEEIAKEIEKDISKIMKVGETINEKDKKKIVFIKEHFEDEYEYDNPWVVENQSIYQDISELIGAECILPTSESGYERYGTHMENGEFEQFMKDTDPDMVFYEYLDVYDPVDKAITSNKNLKNVKAIKSNNCYYIDNRYQKYQLGKNDGFYDYGAVRDTVSLLLKIVYPDQYKKIDSYY